ncbi:response regulator transcription factor [Herbiconiux sp. L3-i23]|uniref:response regulator n=1 Tax=Herbiconiux sp. L3-i23 TaxID=2905871 RepID=UPI00205E0A8C|nr:response regulator transcription factor [Herbiconiux sp. L3-i23]BDI23412.1 DNA-binding response regulator [Herbiconiux sp. L3-i23]
MSDGERRIRVAIVDDQPLVRSGFRMILGTMPDVEIVGEAGTGAQAVALAATARPDVMTMDVQMPDMDGLEATRRILGSSEAPAIIMVTTFDRDDYLFAALEAGASGFLLKNASPEQLAGAVRAVASGEALLSPEVTRRVISRFARGDAPTEAAVAPSASEPAPTATGSITIPETGETLTDREAEVLRLMADGRSNAEIGATLYIGEATVKTHVSRILQKIAVRDRIHAVVYAHRVGLVE